MKKILKKSYQQNNDILSRDTYFNWCPYDVLRNIFQYLNFKDLASAAMVCKTWLDTANHEKDSRGSHCFIQQFNIGAQKEFNVDRIKQSTIQPFVGFFFVALDIRPFMRCEYLDTCCIIAAVSASLPINCKAIMLFVDFTILNKEINTNKIKYGNYHAYFNMVCALLPQIPNIELNIVIIPNTQEDRYGEYTQMIERASEQNYETSACLIVFCSHNDTSVKQRTTEIAYSKFGNNKRIVTFYGAEVHKLCANILSAGCPYGIALLITGSIQTWSICMEHINQTNIIKENLKLFREKVKLQKHSVGFVFTSLSVEQLSDIQEYLTICKELFSEVPLIGCHTLSIFGRDTITYVRPQLNPQKQYFVRFMILTYS